MIAVSGRIYAHITDLFLIDLSLLDDSASSDALSPKGRWVEMELPTALRIWKPRDARFAQIL